MDQDKVTDTRSPRISQISRPLMEVMSPKMDLAADSRTVEDIFLMFWKVRRMHYDFLMNLADDK
jgi:hypothetical protein